MKRDILERQLNEHLRVESPLRTPWVSKIIVCGMGGSGITGDIVAYLKKELRIKIPIESHKTYSIPNESENSLLIFVSFSGNTEETISGFRTAIAKKMKCVGVVAGGGILAQEAKKAGVPRVILPPNSLTPREAVGYNANAVFTLLYSFLPSIHIPAQKLASAVILQKEALRISKALTGTIPLLYTDTGERAIGYVWKMYLNETGKTPAFANVFPEMNHNEIQSFEGNKLPFIAVCIGKDDMSARIQKRAVLTEKILKKEKIKSLSIPLLGKTRGEKFWNSVCLASLTSEMMAKKRNINPNKTSLITELKKNLSK